LTGQKKKFDLDEPDPDELVPRNDLKDTIFVFRGDEMLINNLSNQTGWFVGDVQNGQYVPEYCSIAHVDPIVHKTNLIDGIISGGYIKGIGGNKNVTSFRLGSVEQNAVQTFDCTFIQFLPTMHVARYMHQSCIVRGVSGYWSLLLLGGKATQSTWQNEVEQLDLYPTFHPDKKRKNAQGKYEDVVSNWQVCQPMKSARANFAIQVIKNTVYVFGGVSKNASGDEFWRPELTKNVIERYLPEENVWLEMTIPNTPSLAAFSWCVADDKLIILGGSDGNLLNSDFFVVNFVSQTCEFKPTDFDFSTGMGHLVYRKKQTELQHIGGFNSFGVNYSYKLGSDTWEPLQSCHSIVTN